MAEGILSDEKKAEIRQKKINWSGLAAGGSISKALAEKLSSYSPEKFRGEEKLWLNTFFEGLNEISHVEAIQYLLTVLDDVIEAYPEVSSIIVEAASSKSGAINFQVLLRHITKEDLSGRVRAVSIYTTILSNSKNVPDTIIEPFFNIVRNTLRKTDDETNLTIFLKALGQLLRSYEVRKIFINGQGLDFLCPLLSTANTSSVQLSIQLLYECLYCVWLCSFTTSAKEIFTSETRGLSSSSSSSSSSSLSLPPSSNAGEKLLQLLLAQQLHLLNSLVNVLKTSTKDKVVRVSLAILKNILQTNTPSSTAAGKTLIELGTIKILHNLQTKQWRDEELRSDLFVIADLLDKKEDDLCSIEAYVHEIESGKLSWTPPHLSEKFWKENYTKFEADNFKLVRLLGVLLQSKDNLTLAVTCRDIGNFAVHHPRGRSIVDQYELKNSILSLMSNNDDPAVQRESLLCVQKLLTTKWTALSSLSSHSTPTSGLSSSSFTSSSAATPAGSSSGSVTSSALKNPLAQSIPK